MRDKERGLVPSRQVGATDFVFNAYLNKLNPRDNEDMQKALAMSPDVRFREFLARVSAHRYKNISLATIAKACDISLMEFNAWWNKESTQRAIAIAQTATVKLTEEMVEDASASKEFCPRCDGLGWVGAPAGFPKETPGYRLLSKGPEGDKWIRDCPKCDGSGSIRKVGDAKAKDTLLEMSGIIQRGKAAVSITQNFGGASHASAISSLDEAMTIDISD